MITLQLSPFSGLLSAGMVPTNVNDADSTDVQSDIERTQSSDGVSEQPRTQFR